MFSTKVPVTRVSISRFHRFFFGGWHGCPNLLKIGFQTTSLCASQPWLWQVIELQPNLHHFQKWSTRRCFSNVCYYYFSHLIIYYTLQHAYLSHACSESITTSEGFADLSISHHFWIKYTAYHSLIWPEKVHQTFYRCRRLLGQIWKTWDSLISVWTGRIACLLADITKVIVTIFWCWFCSKLWKKSASQSFTANIKRRTCYYTHVIRMQYTINSAVDLAL